MRDRGLARGLTGVVRIPDLLGLLTFAVNCCLYSSLFLLLLFYLCKQHKIGINYSLFCGRGLTSFFAFCWSKNPYQYLCELCLFNADKEVCFTVGMHRRTIRELEVAGYISTFGQPQLPAVSIDKYISKFWRIQNLNKNICENWDKYFIM